MEAVHLPVDDEVLGIGPAANRSVWTYVLMHEGDFS